MVIRPARVVLPLLALVFAGLALWLPGVAGAHAVLEDSVPQRGATLQKAPEEVRFSFNEPVEGSFGAVRVFDSSGSEVQIGEMLRPDDRTESIGVALPDDLPDGTYTATYQVVSADAHPISGGLVFTIGEGGGVSGQTITELLERNEAGKVTQVGFWFVRWTGYLAIAVAIGLLGFMTLLWRPEIGRRKELAGTAGEAIGSRSRLLLGIAIAAGIVSSLLALAFQGATAAGSDLWTAMKPDVIRDVIDTRYGTSMTVRILAWLAFVPLLLTISRMSTGRRGSDLPVILFSALAALALSVAPGLGGHTSTGEMAWLLFPSDIVHVSAMAVWTGGLAALVFVLPAGIAQIGAGSGRTEVLTSVLLRFSTVALVAVGLIAVSGTLQAVVEVASFPALLDTAFGRAVLIKVILMVVLITLANMNRRRIIPALVARREKKETPGGPGVEIRRNLRLEVVLAVVVLAVSAALVSYPPPESAQAGPTSGSTEVRGDRLDYTVDPALTGSNEVHLYLFDGETGAPVEVDTMSMSFSLPDADIAAIEADLRIAGPGHYTAPSAMLTVPGDWSAEVAIRLSRFEEELVTFEVPVE